VGLQVSVHDAFGAEMVKNVNQLSTVKLDFCLFEMAYIGSD
jgi:hypothetical protein